MPREPRADVTIGRTPRETPSWVKGETARLAWSYYTAATLADYTVERSPYGSWSVRAVVVSRDAFKMAQRPLYFVAPYKRPKDARPCEWRWPVRTFHLEHDGVTFAALLDKPIGGR